MRKMKKFAAGGSDKYKAKYDRKVADIKSDFDKAMKGKTGRAAEVAQAKYDQRMADAKDDLAKWTKSDRTETRAGEKSAERNLSMTRKFGAMKSAVKSDDVAKVSSTDDVLKSVPKPQIAAKATAKTPAKAPAKPAARSTRMGDQGFAYKEKTDGGRPAMAAIRERAAKTVAEREAREKAQKNWRNVRGGSNSGADKASGSSAGARDNTAAGRRERMGKALSYLNPFSYLENKATRLDPSKMASGGAVKKKPTPPRKPLPPTAEEIRKSKSFKDIKPSEVSDSDRKAIERGNRSSGMKKGGKVKKYAAGGLTKIMPTANEMGNLGMAKGGKVKKGMAAKAGRAMTKKSADTMGRAMVKKAGGGKCYAKGGSVSSRADGIARKGKTNCKTC